MLWLGTCIKGLQYQEGWESLVTFHVWCAHVHGRECACERLQVDLGNHTPLLSHLALRDRVS